MCNGLGLILEGFERFGVFMKGEAKRYQASSCCHLNGCCHGALSWRQLFSQSKVSVAREDGFKYRFKYRFRAHS